MAEYQKVADEFGGTDGGNLAALAAGERLYDMGKYEEALKYLLQFDSKEDVIMANAQCLNFELSYIIIDKRIHRRET